MEYYCSDENTYLVCVSSPSRFSTGPHLRLSLFRSLANLYSARSIHGRGLAAVEARNIAEPTIQKPGICSQLPRLHITNLLYDINSVLHIQRHVIAFWAT